LTIKGLVHPKIQIQSSITHVPNVIPNYKIFVNLQNTNYIFGNTLFEGVCIRLT